MEKEMLDEFVQKVKVDIDNLKFQIEEQEKDIRVLEKHIHKMEEHLEGKRSKIKIFERWHQEAVRRFGDKHCFCEYIKGEIEALKMDLNLDEKVIHNNKTRLDGKREELEAMKRELSHLEEGYQFSKGLSEGTDK